MERMGALFSLIPYRAAVRVGHQLGVLRVRVVIWLGEIA